MKNIALIGSTGSIGKQVLEVVRKNPSKYKIVALAAQNPSVEFSRQVREFKPEHNALASTEKEAALAAADWESADVIFNAAGGFAGLEYSLKAIRAKKTLALANKETLVCGGEVVTRLAEKNGAEIIPVDSEHSAIWQCLNYDKKAQFKKLIITASGGAFRGKSQKELSSVTPAQALNHPTWKMGAKITVDSATLMNKGYEVIEAHVLYGTPYSRIDTVIQPQSIIHSMTEFCDGAILAQMSYPTMEIPVQLALSYPRRLETSVSPMDFTKEFSLGFQPLNRADYPCFDLALKCGEEGGICPCVLNAADEEAVKAFLKGRIAFTDIYRVADGVLQSARRGAVDGLDCLKQVDEAARINAQKIIDGL